MNRFSLRYAAAVCLSVLLACGDEAPNPSGALIDDGGDGAPQKDSAFRGEDASKDVSVSDAGAAATVEAGAPLSIAGHTGFIVTLPANTPAYNTSNSPITLAVLSFSSSATGDDYCSAFQEKASSTHFNLVLAAKGAAFKVGSYAAIPPDGKISDANFEADYEKLDATCEKLVEDSEATGTVSITSVSSTKIEGTADVVLASGTLKEAFSFTICEKTLADIKGLKAPTCAP